MQRIEGMLMYDSCFMRCMRAYALCVLYAGRWLPFNSLPQYILDLFLSSFYVPFLSARCLVLTIIVGWIL